jgi:hypothetical protein
MTITAEDLVRREVFYCVSHLVSVLANGTPFGQGDLNDTVEQARELCMPLYDYEEAAIQAGFVQNAAGMWEDPSIGEDGVSDVEQLCEMEGIEPYEREVFEHWIVSDWLADKLAERGEKVDKDFAGMVVWARTTTGQGIASDSVIEQIADDLGKVFA